MYIHVEVNKISTKVIQILSSHGIACYIFHRVFRYTNLLSYEVHNVRIVYGFAYIMQGPHLTHYMATN